MINADFRSVKDVLDYLGERPWLAARAKAGDLGAINRLQSELGAIVDASAARDDARVVQLLNEALQRYPITPRISDHDNQRWHLHVGDNQTSVPAVIAAEALFGLAVLVSTAGPDRLGRCAATGCGRAFVDTSANHSRRYCSTRCATRTNVAAHRRRASQPAGTTHRSPDAIL